MRWSYLIFCCLLLSFVQADPDPKKYKSNKEKINDFDKSLTNDERNFLREVEEKFGVKSKTPKHTENIKTENNNQTKEAKVELKLPFPAVIAIEIVNDTDSKSKGKRTIDANLGYGYKTNEGYSYTYFGKSSQDKGKFMIYPYSQNDIPPNKQNLNYAHLPKSESSEHAVNVEIQPSQAYELVEVEKDEQNGYEYNRPANPLNTKYEEVAKETSSYDIEKPSQTLYTTYNGHEFSGLSKQFPSLMSNYFVDPRQLLNNPQYHSGGLTEDHAYSQSSYPDQHQRVVPVLVLRVPSSYLKNPTAELYADLPKNVPVSRYLNNVNLQDLVNQYFKNSGFSFAPQIMTYQNLLSATATPHHYSNSYVTRSKSAYSDYSGIQYSAVKPSISRYPSNSQQNYVSAQTSTEYQSPVKYQYQYQYEPQEYYSPSDYQSSQTSSDATSLVYQNQQVTQEANVHDSSPSVDYQIPQHSSNQEEKPAAVVYESESSKDDLTHPQTPYHANSESSESQANKNENYSKDTDYGPVKVSLPPYDSAPKYYQQQLNSAEKDTVSILPSQLIHTEMYETNPPSSVVQDYKYEQTLTKNPLEYTLSENYPSKDHTIANVIPYRNVAYQAAKSPVPSVQTVSYVTPTPSTKYYSQYNIMVPQTVLKYPSSDKLTRANLSAMHYLQQNHYGHGSNLGYYKGTQYKASPNKISYPQGYYSYSKRMARPSKTIKSKKSSDQKISA